MNKLQIKRIFLIAIFISLSVNILPYNSAEQWLPLIHQNGLKHRIINGTVKLKKEKFILIFNLKNPESLFINFSDNDYVQKSIKRNLESKYLFPFWPAKSYAYSQNNPDKYIIISDDYNHHFFYKNENTTNFNYIYKSKEEYKCYRIIENYYNSDHSFINISGYNKNKIYVNILYLDYKDTKETNISLNDLKNNYPEFKEYADWTKEKGLISSDKFEISLAKEISRASFTIEFIE